MVAIGRFSVLAKIDPCFGIGDCMNLQDSAVYMRMLIEKRLEDFFDCQNGSNVFLSRQ